MEQDACRVSIVIPVYHVEPSLLDRCLASIAAQTMGGLEVRMVFDEKAEAYEEILSRHRDRGLRLCVEEQDHKGVSSARNRGVETAKGEWIVFVDADDWLEQDAVEKLVTAGADSGAQIVMGEHVMEYKAASKPHIYQRQRAVFCGEEKKTFERDVLKPQTGAGFVWGKAFSRAFLTANGIRFCEALSAAEDAEFMFRAACAASKIIYISEICYHYWFNANSAVRRYQRDYAEKYIRSMEALDGDIRKDRGREHCRETYYSCVLYHLLLIAVNYSFHPEGDAGGRKQMRAFRALLKTPIFEEALLHVHYKDFSRTRQITLWCIKHRLYFAVKWIAQIRHRQFQTYGAN